MDSGESDGSVGNWGSTGMGDGWGSTGMVDFDKTSASLSA
jgi:hypothetical protein